MENGVLEYSIITLDDIVKMSSQSPVPTKYPYPKDSHILLELLVKSSS